MPEHGPLVQFLIVAAIIVGVERMVALAIKLSEAINKAKNKKRGNGHNDSRDDGDFDYPSKIIVSSSDMRGLVASIEEHTRAVHSLLEHSTEVKRVMARAEKTIDRFEN